MITTPEIICDLFSFLDKDHIERIQLVSQLWNDVIIRHKNILPLRQFSTLEFDYEFESKQIHLFATQEDLGDMLYSYTMEFDGTNLSKIEEYEEDEEDVEDVEYVEEEGEEEENEKEGMRKRKMCHQNGIRS